jgi:acetate---CoA ligase (ADP-forming)
MSENENEAMNMEIITGAEEQVRQLFEPRSIAIVGASSRPGALSWWPLHLLQHNGYQGRIFPVNPKYDEIEGVPCFTSIGAIPEPVDVAVIVLNVQGTLEAMRECVAAGVKAVVLPTQGFGEMGEEGRQKEQELRDIAATAGIRIVGTNTDGMANFEIGAVMSIQPLLEEDIPLGPIGVVTHSGATGASLLTRLKDAGLGAKLHVAAGNETDLGLADYLSVLIQDPDIKMVLAYVEAVRKPQDFVKVLELATRLGKPIALIKVGRSEEGARRAGAHTGALAGEDALYEAIFDKWGVVRVSELNELVAVAKLYLGVGDIKGGGVGIISGSGGQCGVAADVAKVMRVAVPALEPAIEARIDDLLTFGAGFNPCDLTGEIARVPTLAMSVYREFAHDDKISAVVFVRKKMIADVSERSVRPLVEAATEPGMTPLAIYSMDGFVRGVEADIYKEAGIPVFYSLSELYTAFRALAKRSVALDRLRGYPAIEAARSLLPLEVPAGGALDEQSSRALLAAYSLPMPGESFVKDAEAAVAAADELGYPVVVKISDPRILHKTEMGGVVVGLQSADAVREAANAILERARTLLDDGSPEGLLVQEQVVGGVELIAGLKVDPEFGPFVLVGLGGVTAELMNDVAIRPAPVSAEEARDMIGALKAAPLLNGFRGAALADVDALAEAVARLSHLGADGAQVLAEVDLNPIVVLPAGRGVRILDSLFLGFDAESELSPAGA